MALNDFYTFFFTRLAHSRFHSQFPPCVSRICLRVHRHRIVKEEVFRQGQWPIADNDDRTSVFSQEPLHLAVSRYTCAIPLSIDLVFVSWFASQLTASLSQRVRQHRVVLAAGTRKSDLYKTLSSAWNSSFHNSSFHNHLPTTHKDFLFDQSVRLPTAISLASSSASILPKKASHAFRPCQ